MDKRVSYLVEDSPFSRNLFSPKDCRCKELEQFVFIMVKENATTMSNVKALLGFKSMEETREWYCQQEALKKETP